MCALNASIGERIECVDRCAPFALAVEVDGQVLRQARSFRLAPPGLARGDKSSEAHRVVNSEVGALDKAQHRVIPRRDAEILGSPLRHVPAFEFQAFLQVAARFRAVIELPETHLGAGLLEFLVVIRPLIIGLVQLATVCSKPCLRPITDHRLGNGVAVALTKVPDVDLRRRHVADRVADHKFRVHHRVDRREPPRAHHHGFHEPIQLVTAQPGHGAGHARVMEEDAFFLAVDLHRDFVRLFEQRNRVFGAGFNKPRGAVVIALLLRRLDRPEIRRRVVLGQPIERLPDLVFFGANGGLLRLGNGTLQRPKGARPTAQSALTFRTLHIVAPPDTGQIKERLAMVGLLKPFEWDVIFIHRAPQTGLLRCDKARAFAQG